VDFFMPEHSDPSSGIRPLLLIDQRTELPSAEWQAAERTEITRATVAVGGELSGSVKVAPDKDKDPAPAAAGDLNRKLSDWDKAKDSFSKIFDEADASVRVLEQEKSRILGLTQVLSQVRESFEALQVRFNHAERRLTAIEHNNARLNYKMDSTSDAVREFKNSEPVFLKESATLRTGLADVERQLAEQTDRIGELSNDNHNLRERLIESERNASLLVGEISLVREHMGLLENSSRGVRELLDQISGDVSRLSGRPAYDPDAAPNAAPSRTRAAAATPLPPPPAPTATPAKPDAERSKLIAELDESISLHQTELGRLQLQVDNLTARAAGSDVTTTSPRRFAIGRGDVPKPPERVAIGELPARLAAEQKLVELKSVLESYQSLVQSLEQSRASLSGRTGEPDAAPGLSDLKLVEATEAARLSTERALSGEADPSDIRLMYEKRAEELRAALMHERLERKFAEGALQASRAERAQLQRELAKIRVTTARQQADMPTEPPRTPDNRGSNAA
jgi:Crescentin protein